MVKQDEKRKYRRIEDEIRVTLIHNNHHTTTSTTNLCKGGAYVCLSEWTDILQEHTSIDLEITLPPREEKISVKGKVAFINTPEQQQTDNMPPGMGIEFISFRDGDDQKLAFYLERLEQIWDFTESM